MLLLLELAVLVPSIAFGIRRLHDTDRSGWWLMIGYGPALASILLPPLGIVDLRLLMIVSLVSLVSLAGLVVPIVLMALDGTKGPNRYGADPKGAEGAPAPAA